MEELRRNRRLARFIVKGKVTGRHLGTGAYGSVEEIEVNGLLHIGKKIHEHLITANNATIEDIARKYSQECQVMSDLRHPNITVFLGLCFIPNYQFPLLVMEKFDGSLDDLLESIPDIPLALKHSLLEDIARGLLYLHSHSPQIIHMDLTAKNVLLTTSLEAKISDFGNSYVVNIQPDFRATSLSTLVYVSPEAMNETPHFSPSLDVFSFGHLILFTLTQVFSEDLLEVDYSDPTKSNKPLHRSEVERRAKYFDQLEDKIVKGQHHPLAQLSKDCLKNNPWQRPSAEQLLAALEDMEEEVEGPYGEFTKLDAIRQVAAMKSLLERDIKVREKTKELRVISEKMRQLQKKLKQAEQTTDEKLEAELLKDIEIEVKETLIVELQETITHLKKKLEEKESQLLYQDALLRQKDSDMQQKDEEVCKKEDRILEKDEILRLRNAELNHKDEEILRRDVRIILRNAELEYKESVLQERDECLRLKISQLQESHSQLIDMDEKLQQLQNDLEEKVAELNAKDYTLHNKDDDVHQINALLRQKSKELRQRVKELQLKVEELQLKDAIIRKKNSELCTTEEQVCQLQTQLEQLKAELEQRDVQLEEVQNQCSKLLETLHQKEAELQTKEKELQENMTQLGETRVELERKDKELLQKCEELQVRDKDLEQKCVKLNDKDEELHQKTAELQLKDERLTQKEGEFQDKDQELHKVIAEYKEKLHLTTRQLEERNVEHKQAVSELKLKEAEIKQKSVLISTKDKELQRKEEDIQKLDTQLEQMNTEIQQKNKDLERKASQIVTIQEQMQKDTELHQKEAQMKDTQLSTIMQHIYQLQEAQEGLRTDLDQRNVDVGRLEEELMKMKEKPQILAATGQISESRLLPSELPLKVEWKKGKDMPHGIRYHPQAVVLHGKIYLGGGKSEKNTQVMVYDPRHELWATLPHYQYELFAMTSIEDQLVLVGGEDTHSRRKTNILGAWDEKLCYWTHPFPPMLTACSSPTVVNYQDKWLIVAGGSGEGGDLFIVEVMDISNGHWYSAPPLPLPASKMSATIIDDNTMVVLGGASGYYFFKKVFKVNLDELVSQAMAQQTTVSSRRLWTAVPSQTPWQKLPDTPFTQSAAVTFRGSLLAVGGQGGAAIHLYHPESRSWVKAGDLPSERLQCACTMLPNGEVFLAGGAHSEELVEILTL